MSTLQGRSISESYKDLLQISNNNEGLDNQLRAVMDGEGDTSSLYVSTSSIQVSGTSIFNGNVGIGTDSPDEALVIKGDDKRVFISSDDYNLFTVGRRSAGELDTAYLAMYDEGDKKVAIDTAGDTFFNGGNVGINTDDPNSLLTIFSTSSGSNVMRIARSTSASNQTNYLLTVTEQSDNEAMLDMQAANGISTVRVKTNGDSYFNGGNVGIGTTTPAGILDLQADAAVLRIRDTSTHSSTSGPVLTFIGKNSSGDMKYFSSLRGLSTGTDQGNLAFNVRKSAADPDIEAMRIDSAGNVGIGNTDPQTTLHIGNSAAGSQWMRFSTEYGDFSIGNGSAGTPAEKYFSIYDQDANAHRLYISEDGNVGIGTDSPGEAFVVKGDDKRVFIASDDYNLFSVGRRSSGELDTAYLAMYDEGVKTVAIDTADDTFFNGGNVGIGTTTPDATLHVRAKDDSENALALWVVDKAHNNSIISAYENGDVRLGSFTYDDATGSVGIGTTSPQTVVHTSVAADSQAAIRLEAGANRFDVGVGGESNSNTDIRDNFYIYDTSSGGDVRFMIDLDGNIGVGVTELSAKFETRSGVNAFPGTDISADNSTSLRVTGNDNAVIDMGTNGGTGTWIQARNKVTDNLQYNLSLNPLGGNVGVGTTAPDAALEVVGPYDSMLKLTREDATYQYAEVHAGAGTVKLRGVDTSNTQHSRFVFETEKGSETLERFRIDTNGNVGVGTSGPSQKFEVKCTASQYNIFALSQHDTAGWGALHGGRMEYTMPGSGSASSRSFAIGKYRPTDTVHACTVLQLKSRDNGTAHLWMDDNNVLRFGTNSSNIGSTTGTSLGTAGTSDERAKNIESGFEYGLDHVMQLQPIAFAFKKDAEQTRTLGFGASASQQIIPESVFDTGNCVDGYDEHPEHEDMNQPKSDDTELGMDYMQLVPVLTKAIQELKAENDALKARVEALETPAE